MEVSGGKVDAAMKPAKVGNCALILRVLALLLTLAAAIVIGVDKQTKVVQLEITPTLPPLNVAATAKWQHLSAMVYLLVSNIIACIYAAISMVILLATRNGRKGSALLIVNLADLIMVGLLFSANGAALAIGLMGFQGNSHVRWNKVCNVFDKFCHQVAASIALSLAGSFAFLILLALVAFILHKRCN